MTLSQSKNTVKGHIFIGRIFAGGLGTSTAASNADALLYNWEAESRKTTK